jgi:nodulation protein E
VTGLGVICAAGLNCESFWNSIVCGASGIRDLDEDLAGSTPKISKGAWIPAYDPAAFFTASCCDLLDRFAQFAVIAAREATASAQIVWTDELRRRTAVFTGSCMGGQETQDRRYLEFYRRGIKRAHPFTVPRVMANSGASHIASELGIEGPVTTFSAACSSSTHAIGQAYWWVRNGAIDLAIAGGSEAPFSAGSLRAWESLRVLSTDTCRPFSRDRSGTILGEGGALLLLEPLEIALRRGATIYAEIVGCGMTSDARHPTALSVEGARKAMLAALEDAGMSAVEVDYVNAHGTGTWMNDRAEAQAIREVFGRNIDHLALSSTKGSHGHMLGASGAIEAVVTILVLRTGILAPTINFRVPDPECDLDVVPNTARRANVEAALCNSFGFGGLNSALVFRRFEQWESSFGASMDTGK